MSQGHVIPGARRIWCADDDDTRQPVRAHPDVTDAHRPACAHAEEQQAERAVMRDRSRRANDAAPSPAGEAAREKRDRARRLERVRERVRQLARAGR
jgi:hypothetical protein